ncbi:thiopeptide-type bacteriocin biosynthesis domain-containing protein [Mucilaginibacter gossypiicola]|uniref:Thiopeptide-type bacteriocin biosynthesis domain-containing protein n=1 Tax=Mucilaginibacter gossypiicola TaxID=551995 RepID=A0A1H8P4I3_9SPHI|nr:lantibiotic dehydratase [Mucilaginibacter gossypiicola]SEO36443.1 thiopeptide-type bacteriocin biosynthesis domain-containing protein [Mucilaginibacter gossypiicola]
MKTAKLSGQYKFSSGLMLRFPVFDCVAPITKETIKAFTQNELFMQALWLTSKDLYEAVLHIDNISDVKKREKLEISLAKFINRSATGTTPLGLFAGCAPVAWGDATKLQLGVDYQHVRLNVAAAVTMNRWFLNDAAIRALLNYRVNKTLYSLNGAYRKIDYQTLSYGKYKASSIKASGDLQEVITFCQGSRSYSSISSFITETLGKTEKDAAAFLNKLIEDRILWSELEPCNEGEEYLDQAIRIFTRLTSKSWKAQGYLSKLNVIKEVLSGIDSVITKNNKVAMILKDLSGEAPQGTLLQVDYFRQGASATLDKAYADKLLDAIDMLNRITPRYQSENLKTFIKRFSDRYHEQEVALTDVLDPEKGIGYAGKHYTQSAGFIADEKDPQYTSAVKWLIGQIVNNPGQETIHIQKSQFDNVKVNDDELPPSFSVMFRVSGHDEPLLYLEHCGWPAGNVMLGRLAGADRNFGQVLNEIAETEARIYEPAIVAEIVHSPDDCLGNFTSAPYRNNQLQTQISAGNQEVNLTDLLVSVKENSVVLRSASLGKRIIPRLNAAYNYGMTALPVYQFLADLQCQDSKYQLGFNLDILPELGVTKTPRVVYEGVILALKTWYMTNAGLQQLLKEIAVDYDKAWRKFIKYWDLPDAFVFTDIDSELVVHTSNRLEVAAWLSSCKKKNEIVLKEYIGERNNIVLKKKDEKLLGNQFVAVLKRGEKTAGKYAGMVPLSANAAKRQFFPGDEWLYVKLYCGVKTAEQVIGNELIQLSKKLYHEDLIDQWFYVRYADPEPHIRFRVHLASVFALGRVIQSINSCFSALIRSKQIWKVQFDTYERELERYGEASIELVEQLFFNDSLAIASLISRTDMTENFEEVRWLWGLLSIDRLLIDFDFHLAQKIELMEMLAAVSNTDINDNNLFSKQLTFKYRHYRNKIEGLFTAGALIVGDDLLMYRSLNNKPVTSLLAELISSGTVQHDLNLLVISLIQMSMNRLFKTRQRVHELGVYDFLLLYYKSVLQNEEAAYETKYAAGGTNE